jgi:tRNA-Thr(GGU) m(6)t(6)A37 methyltransferase TsaA
MRTDSDPTEVLALKPIGWMRTPWREKFGVPRQSGLISEAMGEVEFAPEYADPVAREGLEGFSHLWVTFGFHLVPPEKERLRVRPPRLGGNDKVGVFATRSPFRPNRLGLSVCEIAEVVPTLRLRGVDLVDGTPIYDLRPYLPYVDSVPNARGGFANHQPDRLPVEIADEVVADWEALPEDTRSLVAMMIALNPTPAFHGAQLNDRIYSATVAHWNVSWLLRSKDALVVGLEKLSEGSSR